MINLIKKMIVATLCLLSLQLFASTFVVRPTQMVGAEDQNASTVTELIKTSVSEVKGNEVVTKSGDYVIDSKLIKLGNAYVLTLKKTKDGQIKFTSQLKAERLEEIDRVVDRLVHSVINEVPIHDDVTVKDVSESESVTGVRRRETVNRWYIGLGPSGVINGENGAFNFAFGYFLEIDPKVALKIDYEYNSGSFSYLALGANYYTSIRDTSPVFMGEFGYGGSSNQRSDGSTVTTSGFVLGAGAGYQFFRTSKVNLEILANAALMMNNGPEGVPAKFGVRVGIYW